MRLAYVYKLTDTITGKWYIGARTAKNCCPEDLGVSYFTSSKTVEPLFKSQPNRFEKQILISSEDAKYIISVESGILMLRNAKNDPQSYNMHNGDGKPDVTKTNARKVEGARKSGELNKLLKRGYFKPGQSSKAGKLGCAHNKKFKKGIFKDGNASYAGKKASEKHKLNGTGVFNKEEATKRGKHVAFILNNRRLKCDVCGKVCPPGPMKNHQTFANHIGFTIVA